MNQFEERQNRIGFIKNNNYNNIKFSIINLEEDLTKLKGKKKKDEKLIKSSFKKILVDIGNFLKNSDLFNNLYISFIKYYFKKICEFVQECKIYEEESTKNKEESSKNKEELLKEIKESIPILFEKIQFNYIKDLIFEIIEEIFDEDNVFRILFSFIMQSLWDEIYTIFYLTKLDDKYDEASKNLSRIASLADVCIEIIEPFDKEKTKINNITKVDIQNMKLKIKVRETINKIRKFPNYLDNNSLNELYIEYNNLISNEEGDLEELRKIIDKDYLNFNSKFEEANKFIEWLNNGVKSYDIYSAIKEFLDQYSYDINDDNKNEKWREFEEFKFGKISKKIYLEKIKG